MFAVRVWPHNLLGAKTPRTLDKYPTIEYQVIGYLNEVFRISDETADRSYRGPSLIFQRSPIFQKIFIYSELVIYNFEERTRVYFTVVV